MIWVLVAIMSISLIVMAIVVKDKVREICLKVFCITVTIFLIGGTAESFYGDSFKVEVSSQDKFFEIREFEKYGDLDETIYVIQTDVSNTRYFISDVHNDIHQFPSFREKQEVNDESKQKKEHFLKRCAHARKPQKIIPARWSCR